MKTKNLLQTVLFIIAFVMMNQFSNAQKCNNKNPCPSCYTCDKGQCTPIVCPSGYHCVNGQCEIICPVCPTGSSCINGKCTSCLTVHCPSGYRCIDGHCFHYAPRLSGQTSTNGESSGIDIYPNPVSNSATISFSLDQTEKVSIKIF